MKSLLCILASCFALTIQAVDPVKVLRKDEIEGAKVRQPNGDIYKVFLPREGNVAGAIVSKDGGKSWSAPEQTPRAWASKVFLDKDRQIHAFFALIRQAKPGKRIAIDRFLDVWHVKTSGPDRTWGAARIIQEGWNGSIVDNALQLPSGRIVQPSQDWVPGSKAGPPTGNGYAMTLYSDDKGETWSRSNKITSPAYADYNGANFGACEPSIVALSDDLLWMLMRTQTGFLYESFSKDGAEWSAAQASPFYASTGPPALLRMPDGKLLLFWNNCEMPPKVDGKGVYAGRDVMHGAISVDNGKTWQGFREVALDSRRGMSPPKKGDRGVAYPYAVLSADGKSAEVAAGHGRSRAVYQVDPDWLLEKERSEDYSDGLENLSTFKPFGPVESWWRDREAGAEVVPNPTNPDARVLHIRKPDEKDAEGAIWNFPAGHHGELSFEVMLPAGHQGGVIALVDRFFEPTDKSAEAKATYVAKILPDGKLEGSNYTFPLDQWVALKFVWDDNAKTCQILASGQEIARLPLKNPARHGVCYVWLSSSAKGIDLAGMMVGPLKASVQ